MATSSFTKKIVLSKKQSEKYYEMITNSEKYASSISEDNRKKAQDAFKAGEDLLERL